MTDKNLNELLPIGRLLSESPQEVRGVYLNELKTLYQPLEGLIDFVLDDDPKLDFDRASKAIHKNTQSMNELFEHMLSYLKARQHMNNKTET
jgi:hypothetical protein